MNSQLYADEQAEFKKKYEEWSSKIKIGNVVPLVSTPVLESAIPDTKPMTPNLTIGLQKPIDVTEIAQVGDGDVSDPIKSVTLYDDINKAVKDYNIKISEESINKKKDNNTNNDLLYYVPIGIAVITIIYFVSRK